MSGPRRRSVFASRLVRSPDDGQRSILHDLRHAILNGDEPPGTLIPLDDVARFFGVSQIPVRESLKTLIGEGLVEHQPHVGYSVTMVTSDEFRELYVVRQALEEAALRAAVRRATLEDDAHAIEVHHSLAAAIDANNERAYHAESRRFHMALIRPSHMLRLMRMYESAWNMTEPARPMARVPAREHNVFHHDHERMLAAFVARDDDALVAESRHHFDHLETALSAIGSDPDVFRAEP
ncbi:GntR family transcriptional regulator [soil metagenome]